MLIDDNNIIRRVLTKDLFDKFQCEMAHMVSTFDETITNFITSAVTNNIAPLLEMAIKSNISISLWNFETTGFFDKFQNALKDATSAQQVIWRNESRYELVT